MLYVCSLLGYCGLAGDTGFGHVCSSLAGARCRANVEEESQKRCGLREGCEVERK